MVVGDTNEACHTIHDVLTNTIQYGVVKPLPYMGMMVRVSYRARWKKVDSYSREQDSHSHVTEKGAVFGGNIYLVNAARGRHALIDRRLGVHLLDLGNLLLYRCWPIVEKSLL